MKKVIMSLMLASTLMFTSCLGSFHAVTGLKNWNDGVSNNKFINNLVFWGLNIVPVYGLFALGDVIVFNLIEFWSGSNPLAMNDGDKETQIIEKDGIYYEVTATKNKMEIAVLDGKSKVNTLTMEYFADDKSWNAIKPTGEVIKLSSYEDGFYMVYLPNGEKIKIEENSNKYEGLAILNKQIKEYNEVLVAQK